MRRFDLEYQPGNYAGAGDITLVEREHGDYVLHEDAVQLLNAANANTLAAMRREKVALDATEKAREFYLKRAAELNAEITRLGNVIGEMSE